ncbi:MAG: hypothetical protein H7Z16_18295 [Pyrinomonadaceae bacterium]|nr:hypothetical protein [Pyrinomonadaceae bacterium]
MGQWPYRQGGRRISGRSRASARAQFFVSQYESPQQSDPERIRAIDPLGVELRLQEQWAVGSEQWTIDQSGLPPHSAVRLALPDAG